ncbi:uncharacterized protein LOC107831658 [Nicotiana tabacum]|uniref:Cell division cycle-associated 7-like protein n=1 Tax=Nicotiana tabacum TaxID=4097 RepID=A0A1S4DNE5_TOBAC|nr:PREDICTED: cell division cycle-associated 7-like protein [Nicotiana tabacum]
MGFRGRKRAAPVNIDDVGGENQKTSEYEQLREKRIKENLERMQNLGIFDISLKLKSVKTPTVRKTPQRLSPLQPSGPARRSSRLQNVTPLSYSEVHLSKIDKSLEDEQNLLREEGSRPEIYTEEHEKLLGTTDLSWTLFVDGYGNDGKRIYDPVRGKTCHQCRQKTLGHRTHCCKCNLVQGQFCGDCLYMRYGEHVLEAKKNPDWICPACRGICNCSLCRQAKGWAPTGPFYKKIARLGYKSVAHYLIQTHRASVSSENNLTPFSAKRSLPFSDMEATMKNEEFCNYNSESQGLAMNAQTEVKTMEHDPNENNLAPESSTEPSLKRAFAAESSGEPSLLLNNDSKNCGTNLVLSCDNVGNSSADNKPGNENAIGSALTSSALMLTELSDGYNGVSPLESDAGKKQSNEEKEDGTYVPDDKNCGILVGMVAPEASSKSKKKPCRAAAQVIGSIAGRLRQRRGSSNLEA